MTKTGRAESRAHRREAAAVESVLCGAAVRPAARAAHMPKSTLHARAQRAAARARGATEVAPGRKPELTAEEESVVVDMLVHFADRAVPMTRQDIVGAVSVLVERMTATRRSKLRFSNGIPGIKFLRGFERRHADRIRFGRASRQEAIRFLAINGDVLTTHLAAIENLIRLHDIDSSRLFNLDECGCTPGKDVSGVSYKKCFMRAKTRSEVREPNFQNIDRFTIVPTICADGTACNLMCIFKGSAVRYRILSLPEGGTRLETIADCLPRRAKVTVREDVAGVDASNFTRWASDFVIEVSDLTKHGRKVLLTYDGYRSHLCFRALSILKDGGVIVYALPSHTSGKTQPLDVSIFSPFKAKLNDCIHSIAMTNSVMSYDVFDFCKLVTEAYKIVFTEANIKSAFRQTGLWPINPAIVLDKPMPKSSSESSKILSVTEMCEMLEEKRENIRNGLEIQPAILSKGFVASSAGINLTAPDAMELARISHQSQVLKRMSKNAVAVARADKRKAKEDAAVHARFERERSMQLRRAATYGIPIEEWLSRPFRSIAKRRADAKLRTTLLRAAATKSTQPP
jgi:hypothetical protein